jgi:hypothetical protein
LTQLEWLGLSGTRVSDAGLAHLSRLGALKMLWVEGTPVTADGAARLRQSLPNCTIVGP